MNLESGRRGHCGDSVFSRVKDAGKLPDANHVKDFFKMFRETDNPDLLVLLLSVSEDLDEHCDTAAINIGILFKLDEDFFNISLIVCLFIGSIYDGFRVGGNITLDIQPGNVVLLFQPELVCLLHGQRSPSVSVGV